MNTLRRSLQWYDKCVVYVGREIDYEWPKPSLRHKNAAERSRTQGITSPDNKLKEETFINSIKSYEKLVNGFKPPRIFNYLKKFRYERSKLEDRRKKLTKRYGEFLKTLQVMLKPKNVEDQPISLKVDKLSVEHRIDSKGNITFDSKFIAYVSKLSRKQGMLTAVVEILPMLMEAAGRQDEVDPEGHKTGRVVVSNSKCKQSVKPMLQHLNSYYLSVKTSRKLVRIPKRKRGIK